MAIIELWSVNANDTKKKSSKKAGKVTEEAAVKEEHSMENSDITVPIADYKFFILHPRMNRH